MTASNYLELELLDHLFSKGTYTPPANIYVALCTDAPTDTGTGGDLVEATYTGYARKSTAPADWDTASAGVIDNVNAITFDPCTGLTSTVTHFALCDALTGGNVLVSGVLTSPLAVSNGITPSFAIGALTVTMD